MPTFHLNKLVRDKIVQHQLDAGEKVDSTVIQDTELIAALIKKLAEESSELLSSDSPASELADVQQVIDDLTQLLGTTKDEVRAKQLKKHEKNGGFLDGHFVKTVTCDEDDEWTTYYRQEPDRFPET